jgi:hypothetical protein
VVFAAYILFSIPLLLFLLFLMIRAVPRILATGVDSFIEQTTILEDAAAAGDVIDVAGTIAQMAILVMITGGVVYLLFRLGKQLTTAVWNWSKPSAGRKVVGALGGVAMMLFLAFLWAPQLPLPGSPSGPAYNAVSFEPIRKGERFTIGDAARQNVVVRDPETGQFRQIDPATDPTGQRNQTAGQDAGGGDQLGGQDSGSGSGDTSGGTGQSPPGGAEADATPIPTTVAGGTSNGTPTATPQRPTLSETPALSHRPIPSATATPPP